MSKVIGLSINSRNFIVGSRIKIIPSSPVNLYRVIGYVIYLILFPIIFTALRPQKGLAQNTFKTKTHNFGKKRGIRL